VAPQDSQIYGSFPKLKKSAAELWQILPMVTIEIVINSTGVVGIRVTISCRYSLAIAIATAIAFEVMLLFLVVTGRMPPSGKLSVLNLLTGHKSGFSPRRGDSLHRFTSNLGGPTGTWVRLAVQNFISISTAGWECGPKISKISTFW